MLRAPGQSRTQMLIEATGHKPSFITSNFAMENQPKAAVSISMLLGGEELYS
jgi:hypothetical protein